MNEKGRLLHGDPFFLFHSYNRFYRQIQLRFELVLYKYQLSYCEFQIHSAPTYLKSIHPTVSRIIVIVSLTAYRKAT